MEDLSICRGHVFKAGDSEETFKLSPDLAGSAESPILLQAVNITTNVVHTPVLCLDGTKIIYVFGEDFGDISVGGLARLGKGGVGGALAEVTSYFKKNAAIDGSAKTVSVSLPGNASYKFYLLGAVIQDPNPELQYFPFMLTGKIVE